MQSTFVSQAAQLEKETQQLESEVTSLLQLLGDIRIEEGQEWLDTLSESVSDESFQDRLKDYQRKFGRVMNLLGDGS